MSEAPARAVVGPATDLPPGSRTVLDAFDTRIAVFNVEGRIYAIDDHCPHFGGPLCHGRITGARLSAGPPDVRWGLDNQVIVCPWHGWEFHLASGRTLFDDDVAVATYRPAVENGDLVIYHESPAVG